MFNPNSKQLLLTLNASVEIKRESYLYKGPRTQEMIGQNWVAKRLFLAHQKAGSKESRHTLETSGTQIKVVENDTQIIIQVC